MSRFFSVAVLAFLMIFTLPAEACHKKKHRCGGHGGHHEGHRPPPPRCAIPPNRYISNDFTYNGENHKLIVVIDGQVINGKVLNKQVVVTLRESDYDHEYTYINKPMRLHGPRHGKPPHGKRGHGGHREGGPAGHCGGHAVALQGECKKRAEPVCMATNLNYAYGKGALNPNGLLINFELVGNDLSGGIAIVSGEHSSQPIQLTLQPKLIPNQ
ncbi:MAG: hypothetical protein ACR2PT_23580 [Endozoicomonas sp.]